LYIEDQIITENSCRPATPTSRIKALFVENERGFFILQHCKQGLHKRKNKKDEPRSGRL